MNLEEILSKVDHTNLSVTAKFEDIIKLCDEAIENNCASVCIPPCFVDKAREHIGKRVKLCTVIGFPNGYAETYAKVSETSFAVLDGADEIDMVINLCHLKDGMYNLILDEINQIKEACEGRLLKVIIETSVLTEDEIIKMCEIVEESNADFIKTSTGFNGRGASFKDIKLMREHIKTKKIKASGGINSLEDAQKFIDLGADRLGTSKLVKIINNT